MAFGNAVGEGFNNGEITKLTIANLGPGDGLWIYSTAEPEAGTLQYSFTEGTGTDDAGNAYLAGAVSYLAGSTYSATAINGGSVQYWTAPGYAGPWTLQGELEISLAGGGFVINFANATAAGNFTVDGNLTLAVPLAVTGSSAIAGLPNGGITGTSGAQSAGTAHTHGPGSYSVSNGMHDHGAGSYEVA
jgi:hypothetical protein